MLIVDRQVEKDSNFILQSNFVLWAIFFLMSSILHLHRKSYKNTLDASLIYMVYMYIVFYFQEMAGSQDKI